MAAETFGFCSTQAMASCGMDSPACSATGRSLWTAVSTSSLIQRAIIRLPPFSSVAREPAGGSAPGRYLPDSTPSAIGDHTIWPRPSSWLAGTTFSSMTRHRAEYWGWLDTRRRPI